MLRGEREKRETWQLKSLKTWQIPALSIHVLNYPPAHFKGSHYHLTLRIARTSMAPIQSGAEPATTMDACLFLGNPAAFSL